MLDITRKMLIDIGFRLKQYQGKSELCLDLPETLSTSSDRQWIEVGPASLSHGYFTLMRWSNQEDDQMPPDMFEIRVRDYKGLLAILRALGVEV